MATDNKTLATGFFGAINEGSLTQNPIANRGVDENVSRYTKKNLAETLNKNTADLTTKDTQIKECRIVRIDREYDGNEYDVTIEDPVRTAVSSNNLLDASSTSFDHGLTNLQPKAIMISPTKPQIGDWVLVDLPLVNLRNGPPGTIIKKLDGPSRAKGPVTHKTLPAGLAAALAAVGQAPLDGVATPGDEIGGHVPRSERQTLNILDLDFAGDGDGGVINFVSNFAGLFDKPIADQALEAYQLWTPQAWQDYSFEQEQEKRKARGFGG
jgi:hypothetical protein